MWHPAHVDGRTLVVLSPRRSILGGFKVIESGRLAFDGVTLQLIGDYQRRTVTDRERDGMQPVTAVNKIAECQTFDFFVISD